MLAEREKPNPQEWRLSRAVQVLELAGTSEAMALLEGVGGGGRQPGGGGEPGALERLAKAPVNAREFQINSLERG